MSLDWPSFTVSVAAFGISVAAWWETRRSRKISEESKESSKVSAEAATKSAVEATRLTQIEAARDRVTNESLHRELAPSHPGEIVTTLQTNEAGHASLFGTITLTNDYRVHAQCVVGDSLTPTSGLPLLLHAHTPYPFHIEHWPKDRTAPQTSAILFKLWPPVAGLDDTNPWTCPCDRSSGETLDGPGHWEMRVPLKAPPAGPFAFWA